MANERSLKVYVPVDVRFDETGRMLPHTIIWEDGTKYEIDKVTDIRPAPAQKAGGQGDRYTVRIGGKQNYLFFERAATVTGCSLGRWFVERKIDPVANDIVKAALSIGDALVMANPKVGEIQAMDCPSCGAKQTFRYTRSATNGHIHAKCTSCKAGFSQ